MATITTKDNWKTALTNEELATHGDDLKWMSRPTVAQLCSEENPNLIIFPPSINDSEDKIGNEHIFKMEGNALTTGNVMGFVGRGNTQVRICSRFATDDEEDFFLHYMLRRVFAVNLFDLKFSSDTESIFDFLIYLFPTFLKRAMRQGLYKEYQTRRYNDANVRGRIDVGRHIRQNIPFAGKVAYTTREYATDNHVTQLIRHTIEYIASHPFCGSILTTDDETKEAVCLINQATMTYCKNDLRQVIHQNLRPLHHPYFGEYRNLQKLCMQILRHEELKYGRDDEQIYGILFDGAWLWEEYLYTFLSDVGFVHPRNKEGRGRRYLFDDRSGICYPDFYRSDMVLDAKYKGYDGWNVQNQDLYQVIAYMHILNVWTGGFLVPVKTDRQRTKTLNGRSGTIGIFGVNVNHNTSSFNDYMTKMSIEEQALVQQIQSCLLNG